MRPEVASTLQEVEASTSRPPSHNSVPGDHILQDGLDAAGILGQLLGMRSRAEVQVLLAQEIRPARLGSVRGTRLGLVQNPPRRRSFAMNLRSIRSTLHLIWGL